MPYFYDYEDEKVAINFLSVIEYSPRHFRKGAYLKPLALTQAKEGLNYGKSDYQQTPTTSFRF